jgi:predicted O-methyltransferase YrrM
MLDSVRGIDFDDLTELVPAFVTVVMMVFTYNIANGLTAGLERGDADGRDGARAHRQTGGFQDCRVDDDDVRHRQEGAGAPQNFGADGHLCHDAHMINDQWNAVDQYIEEHLVEHDDALEAALHESAAAGLPAIAVSPAQGKLLHLLARVMNARRILEIGTLGAYSTIWLARALPADGRLISLELSPHHASVASANIARAGLTSIASVRVGAALETLPTLRSEAPFDLFFIDADKANIPEYVRWSIDLARSGSVIIVDNVVREGKLADASSRDEAVLGVRRMHEMLAKEPGASATTIQTVGAKGYDGFTLIMVA